MKKMKSATDKIWQIFAHVFAWMVFILLCPVLILICGVLFIWKYCIVIQVVRAFKSKLLGVVDLYDGLFAVDQYWENSRSSLALIVLVEGSVSIEKFRNRFSEVVLHAKSSEEPGRNVFEKFLQIPVTFGGYYFWSRANYFRIHEHIRYVEQPMSEMKLKKFAGTVMTLPFPNKRPLWEILVFPNYESESKDTTTAIVIRVHHAIADSSNLMNLLHYMMMGKPLTASDTIASYNDVTATQIAQTSPQNLMLFICKAPLKLGNFYLDILRHSDWFNRKRTKSDDAFVSWTAIPDESLLKVQKSCNIQPEALRISLFAGALGKYIADVERSNDAKEEVDPDKNDKESLSKEDIRILIPITLQKNPIHNMTNPWTINMPKIPIRNKACAPTRLSHTDLSISSFPQTGLPQLIYLHVIILSLFPRHLLRYILSTKWGMSVVFQDTPSFSELYSTGEELHLWDHKVHSVIPVFGLHWMQTAVSATTLQYKEKTVFTLMVNAEILPGQQDMLNRITQEFLLQELTEYLEELQDENGFISIPIV